MNDATVWALALARLAVRVELLEQENFMLKQQIEQNKGLRAVETPPKESENA